MMPAALGEAVNATIGASAAAGRRRCGAARRRVLCEAPGIPSSSKVRRPMRSGLCEPRSAAAARRGGGCAAAALSSSAGRHAFRAHRRSRAAAEHDLAHRAGVRARAAGPISLLHRACFPEDPWDVDAIAEIMGIPGFFGRVGWTKTPRSGSPWLSTLARSAKSYRSASCPITGGAGSVRRFSTRYACEARLRGAECVVLEVAVDNDAARALYAGRGFTVVGRRRNYYRQAGG